MRIVKFAVIFTFSLNMILPGVLPAQIKDAEKLSFEIDNKGDMKSESSLLEDEMTLEGEEVKKAEFQSLSLSDFETYVANSLPRGFSQEIRQFGYELFLESPSTFAPVTGAPSVSDYIIVPGDEIKISVWGKIEGTWNVVVDRDGNIILPKIGVFRAAGLSFETFQKALKREFSRYYSKFNFNVSLGSLRGITVYVVGNARRPGSYTVSSLSTLISALFATGGPDKNGSMRNIKLRRNGETVVSMDLYDFLLKGDKSKDVRLLPGDVIYIPPVGALVAVVGTVKKPAIYELKDGERVFDLVKLAGGFTNTAFRTRASIKRIYEHKFTDFFEGNLNSAASANFEVKDGDIIRFYPVSEGDSSVVVQGAVFYPGKFGIRQGGDIRVKDIILLAGGLLPQASDRAEVTRVKITENGPQTSRFDINIKKAMEEDEKNNILLGANDYIFVKTVPEWKLYKTVEIKGEVKYPGKYAIKKGEKLFSLIKRAGGLTNSAYIKGLVFTRERVRKSQQKNLEKIIRRLEKQLIVESSNKIQTALSIEDVQSKKAVFSAKSRFLENLRRVKAIGRLSIKIDSLEGLENSSSNIVLEDGDKIFVPPKPSVVSVTGAVMTEGSFLYIRGKSFSDYIEYAGGYSDYANKGGVFVLKADGRAVKPKRFLFFSTRIEPGDAIVIPEKFEKIAWLREIRDISQILMQIAVTAGVVIKVF